MVGPGREDPRDLTLDVLAGVKGSFFCVVDASKNERQHRNTSWASPTRLQPDVGRCAVA